MVRPPRNLSQPNLPIIPHQELTLNNSLEGPASDPTIAAIVTAMQATSPQMVELTRDSRSNRRDRSPSPHTSTTRSRESRTPTPPPPPPVIAPAPIVPLIPLTPAEKHDKLGKVWAGLQQDLLEPKCKASVRDRHEIKHIANVLEIMDVSMDPRLMDD
ncbi:unnamed protein product [Gordionus sp. m RMFG-2023]